MPPAPFSGAEPSARPSGLPQGTALRATRSDRPERGAIRIQRGKRGVCVFLLAGQAANEDELDALAGRRLGCAVHQRGDLPFGAGDAAGIELPEIGRMCNECVDLFVESHGTPVVSG